MTKHYSLKICTLTFFLLGLLSAFNWYANPYLLFNSPKKENFNALKTEPFYKQLLFKPRQINEKQAKSIIFGSSRAGIAFDPDLLPQPAYNASVGGASAYINYRLLQQALANEKKPEQIIFEVAFFSFNHFSKMSSPNRDVYFENRIKVKADNTHNPLFLGQKLFDNLISLASWDSLRASLRMINKQESVKNKKRGSFIQKENGQWIQQTPPSHLTSSLYSKSLEKFLYKEWFPAPHKKFSLSENTKNSPLEFYRQSMHLLYKHNIKTIIVISPMHANLLFSLKRAGLWEDFEQWKKTLLAINIKEARRTQQTPYLLWDFSYTHPLSSERVPIQGQNKGQNEIKVQNEKRLTWFNDSAHASPLLGALIIKRLLEIPSEGLLSEGFGYPLQTDTIDEKLIEQQSLLVNYELGHPQQIKHIKKLIDKAPASLPY